MECTFCDYYEGSILIMMMMESMPTAVCVRCEASMTTPHVVMAEADTRNQSVATLGDRPNCV